MTADDIMNELYIPYLINSYFENTSIYTILSHIQSFMQKNLCTHKINFTLLIIILIKKASLLRRANAKFSKFAIYRRIKLINNIVQYMSFWYKLTKEQYDMLSSSCYFMEPLDLRKVWPVLNTLQIIKVYEKRCFFVHQRLRTDPRCHPKLRSYVQSFNLDREAFIRHIMLHCFEKEYMALAHDLTFMFWYHFGWTDEIMAFENVMRITVDVSHIALMYLDTFPKDTFIMLLFAIVQFCWWVAKKLPRDKQAIRCILLKTLFSMSHIVNKTHYREMYNALLKRIQDLDPYLQRKEYFHRLRSWINMYFKECESLIPQINKDR